MATLDENPIKQSLLKAIRKGNCQKVREILTTHSELSPDETVDSAQNRLLHKAARGVSHVNVTVLLNLKKVRFCKAVHCASKTKTNIF